MKKTLLFYAAIFLSLAGFSQNLKLSSRNGVSDYYNKIGENQKIPFSASSVAAVFNLNKNAQLILRKTELDRMGFIHYRFLQTYKNIPVEKSMFVVHTKNGVIQSTSGAIVTEFDNSIDNKLKATVTAERAVSIAVSNVRAQLYAWQDAGMQRRIKAQSENINATYYPKAQLVFYNPQATLLPRELRLCYKVNVYALKPLSKADYFIDASTGEVVGKEDHIYTSDVVGTANTAWSGSRNIHSDKVGTGNFRLRDYTRGNGVITLHGENGQYGNDYTSTTKNWSLSGFDQAAMDAHYGVEKTYTFYKDNFGRNSYDDAGTALYSYVNEPTYIDNAFWDGSAMNFCKRSTNEPGGVTGIDVTGHELTHGVTQETCGLEYSNEPGAMNESLSDIMGKSVQFYSKPGDINWLLSNDMNWIIRSMSNPNAEGQPDTYLGTYWYTGSNQSILVHTNSGVGNFMFYLLVQGGSGTNDNGDAYKVVSIGLSKADQIMYRCQTVYLTSTSDYADWRTAAINSATDLYGGGSQEVLEVKNAFHAVGIGSDSSECDVPSNLIANNITKTAAKLTWDVVSGAPGYNLQWKLSSGSTYKNVPDLTTNTYQLSGLKTGFSYDFRVQTKCTSGTSSYSQPYTFCTHTANGGSYCNSYSSSSEYEYIQRVQVGNIDKTSGNNGGYRDFTNLTLNVIANTSHTIKLTPGFTSTVYTEKWTVYIDYNRNGNFTDAGEKLGSVTSNSTTAVSLPFTVPASALNGKTRMRIQMTFGTASTNPCAVLSYGEVEDYSVYVSGGTFSIASDLSVEESKATALSLMPNPVRSYSTTASLNLIKQGNVTIKIADVSGRVLVKQDIKNLSAGKHSVTLNNLVNLYNGVFMVVAEQDGVIIGRAQLAVDR